MHRDKSAKWLFGKNSHLVILALLSLCMEIKIFWQNNFMLSVMKDGIDNFCWRSVSGPVKQGMTYCGFFSICRLRLICLQNNRQSADCRSRYRSYLHKPPQGHARQFWYFSVGDRGYCIFTICNSASKSIWLHCGTLSTCSERPENGLFFPSETYPNCRLFTSQTSDIFM